MADKVLNLALKRDYNKFLYFIDGAGNVCRRPKDFAEGCRDKILVAKAIERDANYLYFIDKDGDVARCNRVRRRKPRHRL